MCAVLLVAACGPKRITPPQPKELQLGDQKALFREYGKLDVCLDDPRRVADELEKFNLLLAEFLNATSASADGVWADEHLALLKEAQANLPAPLAAHEASLKAAARCPSTPDSPFPEIARRGEEMTRQSKKRLEEAPALLAEIEGKKKLADWQAGLPGLRAQGKTEWCPAKPKAGAPPELYFASEDPGTGTIEWLFCDGARVVKEKGGTPRYEGAPVDPKKKTKKTPDKHYLDTAAAYPAEEVKRFNASAAAAPVAEPESAPAAGGAPDAGK